MSQLNQPVRGLISEDASAFAALGAAVDDVGPDVRLDNGLGMGTRSSFVEVTSLLGCEHLAGCQPLLDVRPLGDRLEHAFLVRSRGLNDVVRDLLLLAADPAGELHMPVTFPALSTRPTREVGNQRRAQTVAHE